jgi:predicted sugar kinase
MEVAERNRLIKKDLVKIFGYKNVSVVGDRGTAYGWITIRIKQPYIDKETNLKRAEEIEKQVREVLKKFENELSYYYDDFGEKRAEVIIRVDFI